MAWDPKNLLLRLVVAIQALFFSLPLIRPGEPTGTAALERNLRSALRQPPSREETRASEACRALFAKAGRPGLERLSGSADVGIALLAAHKLHVRGKSAADLAGRRKFVELARQRIPVDLPSWWAGWWTWTGDPLHYLEPGQRALLVPLGRSRLVLGARRGVFTVEASALSLSRSASDFTVALAGPDLSFLAFPSEQGYPYDLLAVETRTGRVLWRSQAWGTMRGVTTGQHLHRITIERRGQAVVVFGAASGLYAEGFDVRSGAELFRFSDNCWSDR